MSSYSAILTHRRFPPERPLSYNNTTHSEPRAYLVPASFSSWSPLTYPPPHPDHSAPDLDSAAFSSYSAIDGSSWNTTLPNFPLRPASDNGHSFVTTVNDISRSLSSSPGSSGHISTPRDWPITPSTTSATTDDLFSSHPSPRASHSPEPFIPTSVKVEPEEASDGCFIMENPTACATYLDKDPAAVGKAASFVPSQALAPPTEVPLRATQAPKKMKGMMGVFRINPFAMHSGSEGKGTAPTVCWEPGPLDEEPLMFEFQLDLIGYGDGGSEAGEDQGGAVVGREQQVVRHHEESQDGRNETQSQDPTLRLSTLHAFSPEFELQDEYNAHGGSEKYRSTSSSIPQVAGDQTTAALLPEDQRNTLDYRPHSSASSYAPIRSTWDLAERANAGVDAASGRFAQHLHGRDQVTASDDREEQGYQHSHYQGDESSAVVETAVVDSGSCSYPLIVVQASQPPAVNQQSFLAVDPEQYQRHISESIPGLGLYVGGGDYGRDVGESTSTVVTMGAHIPTCTSLKQPGRSSNHRSYEHHHHHPYLRSAHMQNSTSHNKVQFPSHARDCGYDEYDEQGYSNCEQVFSQRHHSGSGGIHNRFWSRSPDPFVPSLSSVARVT